MQRLLILSLFSTLLATAHGNESPVTVKLDPGCIRNIGGVTQFSRKQFITIHEGFGSSDITDEDVRYLENDLEVSYGRDGGFLTWIASITDSDPNDPDKPNYADIKAMAKKFYEEKSAFRLTPESTSETIFATHPEFMHATPDNTFRPWGPRSFQTSAEFTERLLKTFWPDGKGMPKYLEVLNEPFIHKEKNGHTVEALSEQHNVVAKHLHKTVPDILVGGYCAAWVDVEVRDFGHWNDNQKKFMDIAGKNMDFWSYHIYDGVNVKGKPSSRVGSNSEAVMDLVDTYSFIKFGVAKPILISEFGGIPRGNMKCAPYNPTRSAHMIRSTNGQLMTFMDHPDRLMKVVPYFLGKATWTYDLKGPYKPGNANPFLLWRRQADGYFVKTDLVKYYEFWKGINGEWRKSSSSNPDIRAHLLADDKTLNVLLMNIDTKEQSIKLDGLQNIESKNVVVRSLRTHGREPVVADTFLEMIPTDLTLAVGESLMIRIRMDEEVKPSKVVKEERFYPTDYLKDIKANKSISYTFENVKPGKGTAVLRLSIGRKRTASPLPTSVMFNGKEITIPNNWAGDQGKRGNFFGMIEFNVPAEYVKNTNTVSITYPDNGGKVACAVLQINATSTIEELSFLQKIKNWF